ncbi:MAG: hypothetical protein IKA10_08020 [Oscillospiraceae bacterium]|nr:hypothetical protein [Oscillospiraceae bacterium]
MKKLVIAVVVIIFLSLPVSAQGTDNGYSYRLEELLSEYNISYDKLKEYPFETLWETVKKEIKDYFVVPLDSLYKITAILLVTAMINFLNFDNNRQIVQIINMVAMLIMFYTVFDVFTDMTKNVSDMLYNLKNFMLTFVPVLGGITFASGEVITSSVYTGFFLITVVAVANICVTYIIPSINLYLAVGVTSGITSVINLKPLCDFYSKTVKLAMTAVVSVLCFMLSLQNVIAQGKDGLALKAGKLLVTSAVPIIGSSLENAVGSVYASMGVLKGFCGLAGIAVVTGIFLPNIITLTANWICYQIISVISEMLENSWAKQLFEYFIEVIEILLSVSVLFMVLLLFSLTVMIKATGI